MRVNFNQFDVVVMGIGGRLVSSQLDLTWTISPVRSLMDEVVFTVERCQSPAFDVLETKVVATVAGVPEQQVYEAVDRTPKLENFWRRYFYRVVASGPGSEVVTSEAKTWEADLDVYESEIVNRNDFLLQYNTGTPCFAFIQRTADAPPCTCVDPATYRQRDANCPSCLNTGRQRPYFAPIQLYVDLNPDAKQVQVGNFGELHPFEKDAWSSAFPSLKPRDLILEAITARAWRIVNVRTIQPRGCTIQHVFRMEIVNPSDVEYSSPVLKPDPTARQAMIDAFQEDKKLRRF
jgi:hypothetical protein